MKKKKYSFKSKKRNLLKNNAFDINLFSGKADEQYSENRELLFQARNVMTTERYSRVLNRDTMSFNFDLQLFGGDAGKILFCVAGFFLGGGFWTVLGAGCWLGGAMMGLALFSSIWGALHRDDPKSSSPSSVTRFDRSQEGMSSENPIQIVYGERMIVGNQTYHQTNADANTLHKHVALCESDIFRLESLTANGLAVPTASPVQTFDTYPFPVMKKDGSVEYLKAVSYESNKPISGNIEKIERNNTNDIFIISNRKYTSDQWNVYREDKRLALYSPEKTVAIDLKNVDDMKNGETYWEWQCSVAGLIAYINRLGCGWEAYPCATTKDYPADLGFSREGDNVYATSDYVKGGSHYTFNQNVTPSNYKEVGGYPNLAWIDAVFKVDDTFSGNPNVECLVKGRIIYDTRYGIHCYSTNPAMCLRDFLLNKRFGGGYWITPELLDEDSFKESADYCDEIITFRKNDGSVIREKRFELNIVIDTEKSLWDWVEDILATFCGFMVMSKGKLALRIEKKDNIVYKFDDTNISDLSVSQMSIDDCPNRYNITCILPENNWKSAKVTVEDFADQFERNKTVIKEVNLEGVTSQSQALRLGRFYRDYNKLCAIMISFKTGHQAAHLEPGDVITLTYRKALVNMPIRITEIKEDEKGEYSITGRQYNETIYNDSLGANLIAFNYCQQQIIYGDLTPPSNVNVSQQYYLDREGNSHSVVIISWDGKSQFGRSKTYNVYRRSDSSVEWEFLINTPECRLTTTESIGAYVQYAVCAVVGEKVSDFAISKHITIEGKDEPPNPVSNLRCEVSGEKIVLTWIPPNDPDIKRFRVTANGQTVYTTISEYSFAAINGENIVRVEVEDYGGNISAPVENVISASLVPSPVFDLKEAVISGAVFLTWGKPKNATSFVVATDKEVETTANSLTIPVSESGSFSVTVYAKNKYGLSDGKSVTVVVTLNDLDVDPDMNTIELLEEGTCLLNCHIEGKTLYFTNRKENIYE